MNQNVPSPDEQPTAVLHRYFVYFSYDGTDYHGWQIQPNAVSVQEKLDQALTTLLRETVHTVGAGRTDTGVHAAAMVAHFDVTDPIADLQRMADKLNRILPPDIAVRGLRAVAPNAHARFDARSRTYHYHVYMGKQPFLRHYATRLHFRPDFAMMNAAAATLLEYTDFTSFSKLHTDVKTNICHIRSARWVEMAPDYWRFEITADRFLRNMVRAIVGTLLEVGRGRMSIDDFRRVITAGSRQKAGESVPAQGLSLVDVSYDL